MARIFAGLLAVFALVAISAYGYWRQQTSALLDLVSTAFARHGIFTYEERIASPFSFSFGLRDIKFVSGGHIAQASSVFIRPESLRALKDAPGLAAALLSQGTQLEVRGLTLTRVSAEPEAGSQPDWLLLANEIAGIPALGCGARQAFSRQDLAAMGYTLLASEINAKGLRSRQGWTLDLGIGMPGLAEYRVRLKLPAPPRSLGSVANSLTQLQFQELLISRREDGIWRRATTFCSAEQAMSVADHTESHLEAVQQRLVQRFGAGLNPSTLQAYRDSLNHGASLGLAITPPADLNREDLPFFRLNDALSMMGMSLQLDQQDIADFGVIVMEPAPAEAVASDAPAAPLPDLLEWSDLEAAQEHRILVATIQGEEHQGILRGSDPAFLILEKQLDGGRFTFPIPRDSFASARVID